MAKVKKFLLLGFNESDIIEYIIGENIVRGGSLLVLNSGDSIKKVSEIIAQLHLVDGVFLDTIFYAIDKGISYYNGTSFTSVIKLVDRLNEFLDNNKDRIYIIHKNNPEHKLDYLFSLINNRIIVNDDIELKKFFNNNI